MQVLVICKLVGDIQLSALCQCKRLLQLHTVVCKVKATT